MKPGATIAPLLYYIIPKKLSIGYRTKTKHANIMKKVKSLREVFYMFCVLSYHYRYRFISFLASVASDPHSYFRRVSPCLILFFIYMFCILSYHYRFISRVRRVRSTLLLLLKCFTGIVLFIIDCNHRVSFFNACGILTHIN